MKTTDVNALKTHVSIFVSDIERSIEFYRWLFGMEPSKVRKGYAKFDVTTPPLNFVLNESLDESAHAGRKGLSHLGIQVVSTEEVVATRERWKAAGLETRDEMSTICCYALQDKSWVRDPDGNEWEVFAVLKDNLPEKSPVANSCCELICCAPAEAARG